MKKEYNKLAVEVDRLLKRIENEEINQQLLLLESFFVKNKKEIDSKLGRELLSRSINLQNVIGKYISEFKQNLTETNLKRKNISSNIIGLIEAYCEINKIIYNDNSEVLFNLQKDLENNLSVDSKTMDILSLYGIDENSSLNSIEEKRLFIELELGNENVKECILKKYMWFVIEIAKESARSDVELMDLIQEGSIGLLKAIENFNLRAGEKFTSFAYKFIKNSIDVCLKANSKIVKSDYKNVESYNKLELVVKKLEKKLGRIPTTEELANFLEISEGEIKELNKSKDNLISLDEFRRENDLEDYFDNSLELAEKRVVNLKLKREILTLLEEGNLTELQRKVIYLRYGFDGKGFLSFKEVAELLGVSRANVNDIEKKALKKVRQRSEIVDLSTYMDVPSEALDYVNKCNIKIKKK